MRGLNFVTPFDSVPPFQGLFSLSRVFGEWLAWDPRLHVHVPLLLPLRWSRRGRRWQIWGFLLEPGKSVVELRQSPPQRRGMTCFLGLERSRDCWVLQIHFHVVAIATDTDLALSFWSGAHPERGEPSVWRALYGRQGPLRACSDALTWLVPL